MSDSTSSAHATDATREAAARQVIRMVGVDAPTWPTAALATLDDGWKDVSDVALAAIRERCAELATGEPMKAARLRSLLFLVAVASEKGDERLADAMQPLLTPPGLAAAARAAGSRRLDFLHAAGRSGAAGRAALVALQPALEADDPLRAALGTWLERDAFAPIGVHDAMWWETGRAAPWDLAPDDEIALPLEALAPSRDEVMARRKAMKRRRAGGR